jgi:hypothetical protein
LLNKDLLHSSSIKSNESVKFKKKKPLKEVDAPEILNLLKRSLDLNSLNEKNIKYLTSENQNMFEEKDI